MSKITKRMILMVVLFLAAALITYYLHGVLKLF